MGAPLKLEFVTSAAEVAQLPATEAEIAVIGRSNVGKSSLLNALAAKKSLAKVSSNPGRTQLLNCFALPDGTTLVDLPGFGYASTASQQTRAAWRQRMERYLLERDGLVLSLLLVDGEIGPAKLDLEILDWLRSRDVPFLLVATKWDKVKASKRHRRQRDLSAACAAAPVDIAWVSAQTGAGIDDLRSIIRNVLEPL